VKLLFGCASESEANFVEIVILILTFLNDSDSLRIGSRYPYAFISRVSVLMDLNVGVIVISREGNMLHRCLTKPKESLTQSQKVHIHALAFDI